MPNYKPSILKKLQRKKHFGKEPRSRRKLRDEDHLYEYNQLKTPLKIRLFLHNYFSGVVFAALVVYLAICPIHCVEEHNRKGKGINNFEIIYICIKVKQS
jgi:hypothetical protein